MAFLKDVVSGAEPRMRWALVVLLATAFLCLIGAIAKTLRFISSAAGSVLTTDLFIGSPDVLEELQEMLSLAQRLFFFGIATFAAFAICSLLSWTVTPT